MREIVFHLSFFGFSYHDFGSGLKHEFNFISSNENSILYEIVFFHSNFIATFYDFFSVSMCLLYSISRNMHYPHIKLNVDYSNNAISFHFLWAFLYFYVFWQSQYGTIKTFHQFDENFKTSGTFFFWSLLYIYMANMSNIHINRE